MVNHRSWVTLQISQFELMNKHITAIYTRVVLISQRKVLIDRYD